MEASFNTFTQYDKRFSEIIQKNPSMKNINFCPFYSLLTALQFMINSKKSKSQHELCVINGVLNHTTLKVANQMTFIDLIKFTNLKSSDIQATSFELIAQNIIGYDVIFPEKDKNKNYCVIFLKNGTFFVVLHTSDDKFHVRDCHEGTQIGEMPREEVQIYLNEIYHFNKEVDIDGYKVEEYSNIEFLYIDEPFASAVCLNSTHILIASYEKELILLNLMGKEKEEKKKEENKTENGIDVCLDNLDLDLDLDLNLNLDTVHVPNTTTENSNVNANTNCTKSESGEPIVYCSEYVCFE